MEAATIDVGVPMRLSFIGWAEAPWRNGFPGERNSTCKDTEVMLKPVRRVAGCPLPSCSVMVGHSLPSQGVSCKSGSGVAWVGG